MKTPSTSWHSISEVTAGAGTYPERVGFLVIGDMLTGWTETMSERARLMAERPALTFASRDEAAARFRLTPPETRAPSDVLRHLAETGVVEGRGGVFTFAFDRHVFLHPPLDPWPFLPRIQCPTLVIRGAGSIVMPRDAGERVAAALKRASLVEVKDAWHHLILDDPAAFSDAVGSWLDDIHKEDSR